MIQQEKRNKISRRSVIQGGVVATIGNVGSSFLLGSFTKASAETQSSAKTQRWTLGNGNIQRVVAFTPGKGIVSERLFDVATRAEFVVPDALRKGAAVEFSFRCNGHSYRGTDADFELVSAEEKSIEKGKSLAVVLRNKQLGLDVAVIYEIYDGHSAVRKHLLLRNTGSAPLTFAHLTIEALSLSLGPENETILHAQYGTIPRETFYTGRSEDAGLLVANSQSGTGVAILSEVPGYMKRTEIGGWSDPDRVRVNVLYDTDLMPFERSLAGGEEFRTASVTLLTFRRDDGFQDPCWVLPSYAAKILMRRVDEHGAPWIYNTWEPFERDINHETALQLIEAAGSMGMDIFTIDDGWQSEYGENVVDLKSFPGGLQSILEAVESKGMRLGLWIPLAAIGMETKDYREHLEWASRDQEGKLKVTGTKGGSKVVMCLASAFRDAAAERINDAIERFHLAYVKLDLTTIFNTYGEAPGCWAKGHDHPTWAESLNRIYEGIAYITNRVYSKHPDVLIDLTFELWGQKHVIDAGLLAAGDLDWISNIEDAHPNSAGPIQARQLLYQRAASMPVESMLIGNLRADQPTIQECFATAIGSAPLLLGDLRKLSSQDRAWYREKITWFKALRKRCKISESFFPLGSWQQTSSDKWDGFARLARSGEGVIAVFRNKSNADSIRIELPLMPQGRFQVRSVITGKSLGVFTHTDWARGIVIPTQGIGSVEILEVVVG